ncbi:MAG TPA: PDDEXK nuclease domain-containing protein [Thermomicrobiales bacterium]|nr:PDDEXK nuclease domain-containing protein [Thermomicrobiales bacterium]
MTSNDLSDYARLLGDVRSRIQAARSRAALAVNAELIRLYWDIGQLIDSRQAAEGWGARVVDRLAADIRNDLPEIKGFSRLNIQRMVAFFRAYRGESAIVSQAVTQLPATLEGVPWGHHVVILTKIKDPTAREWYLRQTVEQGWSRSALTRAIERDEYGRAGRAVSNFARTLPPDQAAIALQSFKDPYIFDFLTLDTDFREAELEAGLIEHVERFLLELGQGFAFVGRQIDLAVGSETYRLDLLFYHLRLRAFIVVELKLGAFKPEYAGKLNFYCSVVDDVYRHDDDTKTIGLLLCQTGDRLVAEYALRDIHKPLGLSTYDLTRSLPAEMASSLPTIEQIESELGEFQQHATDV